MAKTLVKFADIGPCHPARHMGNVGFWKMIRWAGLFVLERAGLWLKI